MKLLKEVEGASKKFCFGLKNDKRDLVLAADEEEEYKEWVNAIESNLEKDPAPPLKKEKRKSRAQVLAHKAKKNAVGKMATTKIGKKAIRSQAPDEVTNLVLAVKGIVEKESKNHKKAYEIEDSIYKIGIKAFFLIENGTMTFDQLLTADKPLRSALEILAKCYDHAKFSRNPNEKLLMNKLGEVQKYASEACNLLCQQLESHVKPKNITRIRDIVDYLADPQMLLRIFTDPLMEDDLQELIGACEHYTQFHFYPGEK